MGRDLPVIGNRANWNLHSQSCGAMNLFVENFLARGQQKWEPVVRPDARLKTAGSEIRSPALAYGNDRAGFWAKMAASTVAT
jgi:hypothetical protein